MACSCQRFGKSGVPWPSGHRAAGKCMVCGEYVDPSMPITGVPGDANRLPPEDRYMRDPMFHHLVDMLRAAIERCDYTPTELREAAILAATLHEQYTTKRILADRR